MNHIVVIGGADGPTAVSITSTGTLGAGTAIALLAGRIAVMLLAAWLYHRHRKKQ